MGLGIPAVIDVVIPTFGRWDRLHSVYADVAAAASVPTTVVFVVEEDDTESKRAAEQTPATVLVNRRAASYAGAMNTAIRASGAAYVFAGADDLHFHPGWDEAALAVMDADPAAQIVGTNDLGNPYVLIGEHATHYLIRRSYVTETGGTMDEGPGIAFHEGYDHNYTDTEIIGVAKARHAFRPCLTAVVEHLHMLFGKSECDATYERGFRRFDEDEARYLIRKQMWIDLLDEDISL